MKQPAGRPRKGCLWNTKTGVWEPDPAASQSHPAPLPASTAAGEESGEESGDAGFDWGATEEAVEQLLSQNPKLPPMLPPGGGAIFTAVFPAVLCCFCTVFPCFAPFSLVLNLFGLFSLLSSGGLSRVEKK